ncbi:hypothetical protein Egran_03926 [Elaphomyces granulatus]|uniref:Uncharacterized protein n=1 Tax=Elaphomyces granulatus TaxID=519963 RepID=A0A232LVY7_9EURO|nr:hypothetical protein Egran_03926 [Elaphomyces granulatus]
MDEKSRKKRDGFITPRTSSLVSVSERKWKWHDHLTLDVLLTVLRRTFLHPFVAWVVVLCLRAQVTPVTDPAFIIATGYAVFLTLLAAARLFNDRFAYGIPREVDLEEEVIVVTGGASGLGQLIAQIYGMRGATVAVLDIKEVADLDGWDELSNVEYYKCDVGNRHEVEAIARRIEDDLGKPTVLINCAAAAIHGQPFLSLQSNYMMKTIQTNLLAPFHTMQTFLPGMIAAESGGTIVNVSSVLGHLTAAFLSDYSTSKAGLSALHRTLEAELRMSGHDDKVKMLLVEPGLMATPLFEVLETPNKFLAPVLEPVQVARDIVSAINMGKSGVIRLPAFAAMVNWYAVMPASLQRLARYLSGIDGVMAKAYAGKSRSSSTSESDMEVVDVE